MLPRASLHSLIACLAAASALADQVKNHSPAATAPAQSQPATSTAPAQTQPATEEVGIAAETFRLELAADVGSRDKGLMGRDHIDSGSGMLFIYAKPQALTFWMANCVIDIDILFLDAKGRIVSTYRMKAEPPRKSREAQDAYEARLKRYNSRLPAQFAIELKAGTIERLKLKPGQRIELETARLVHQAH